MTEREASRKEGRDGGIKEEVEIIKAMGRGARGERTEAVVGACGQVNKKYTRTRG